VTSVRRGRVVVVATRDAAAVRRSVAAVDGMHDVVVVDPLGCAGDAGVRVIDANAAAGHLSSGPVLALFAGETPSRELLAALPGAEADVGRVQVVHRGRGWSLEPRRGEVRWGRWGADRLGPSGSAPTRRARRLPGVVIAEHGDVESTLQEMDARADAVAVLLDAATAPVALAPAVRAVLRRGFAALAGRAPSRLGFGRWIGAALLAYGDALTYAKLLERRGSR